MSQRSCEYDRVTATHDGAVVKLVLEAQTGAQVADGRHDQPALPPVQQLEHLLHDVVLERVELDAVTVVLNAEAQHVHNQPQRARARSLRLGALVRSACMYALSWSCALHVRLLAYHDQVYKMKDLYKEVEHSHNQPQSSCGSGNRVALCFGRVLIESIGDTKSSVHQFLDLTLMPTSWLM